MPARAARYRSLEPSIDASVVIAVTALELANGLAELSARGGWVGWRGVKATQGVDDGSGVDGYGGGEKR